MGASFLNGRLSTAASWSSPLGPHTVSFWFRLDVTPGGIMRVFGNSNLWEWRTNGATNTLLNELEQSGTSPSYVAPVGNLHHVATCIDPPNTTKAIFVDGVQVSIVNPATFAGQQSGTLSFGDRATVGAFFDGFLDDFRIYDRFLPQNEVETIYACRGTDGLYDGLIHWWQLNEGAEGTSASIFRDIIGGDDLTVLTGSAPVYAYDAGIKNRRRA